MTEIVVLDGYAVNPGDSSWAPLAACGTLTVYDRSSPSEIAPRARAAEIVLVNKTKLTREALAALPPLRGIGVLATGVDAIDVLAATELGIPVCNVPSYSTASVAQHTVALLLELCHRTGQHDASVHAGDWQRAPDYCYWLSPLEELQGKTLGIVGFGAIGRRVAQIARALGMEVCAARLAPERADRPGSESVARLDLDELFRSADVISLHCPLTRETAQLVSERRLALMKPSAFLINTARGGLIEEAALRRALDAGALAGAALDVLSSEPPDPSNPLLGAARCIITPHLAWSSFSARQRLISTSVDNVRAMLGGTPIHVVNPDYSRHVRDRIGA